jgi:site-specific DNA-cytosine methylase
VTLEPYVGVSDVLVWVSDDDVQTCQPSESLQLRRERPFRSADEPAYVVRTSTPHAVVDPDSVNEACTSITDTEYERFSVGDLLRLQSFPTTFRMVSDNVTDNRCLIGNAVPPRLAESVAEVCP